MSFLCTLSTLRWSHWRISNSGTKWNAYETDIDSCSDGSVELYFYTANDGVIPIIKKVLGRGKIAKWKLGLRDITARYGVEDFAEMFLQ